MAFAPAPSAFLPLTNTLIAYLTGLLEQWIEYDLAGRVNPYRLADARWALRRAVSFERINVGLNNSAVPEFRRRDDALIAIALELIQSGPMCS